ncbi:MAG: glutamate-5-semialdehyde dehydrogenase [Planctomycetes bacterium]|nr:glutamate-5-semialdehyde dehydrogenase [Planctomycetota bacterium]
MSTEPILAPPRDLEAYCAELGRRARSAERLLRTATGAQKNNWLLHSAAALESRTDEVLEANARDLTAAKALGLSSALLDRLKLTPARLHSMADGLRAVAALPDPVGRILDSSVRPNGLQVAKVAVPLGVILFLYEARPNVTADAAALCVKSGNALILRGGKEALHSNIAVHGLLQKELPRAGLPADAVQLVAVPEREAVSHLLKLREFIDLVIPRGGEGLIRRVEEEATMPVLKHYKGNCHVYVDAAADLDMAENILLNAKCQRPGVCNAAESLLVHAAVAQPFLERAGRALRQRGVELRGCERTQVILEAAGVEVKPATQEDHAAEFLDLILSIKVVDNLDEAVAHIARYGSGHSEAIVTNDLKAARRFTAEVDASALFVNASTRFNDGGELGLGAEIGISTDKFHARGPCGLLELTSYKYVVHGDGQIRT